MLQQAPSPHLCGTELLALVHTRSYTFLIAEFLQPFTTTSGPFYAQSLPLRRHALVHHRQLLSKHGRFRDSTPNCMHMLTAINDVSTVFDGGFPCAIRHRNSRKTLPFQYGFHVIDCSVHGQFGLETPQPLHAPVPLYNAGCSTAQITPHTHISARGGATTVLRVRAATTSTGWLGCPHDQVCPRVRLHRLAQLTDLQGKPTETLNKQVGLYSPSSSIHNLLLPPLPHSLWLKVTV